MQSIPDHETHRETAEGEVVITSPERGEPIERSGLTEDQSLDSRESGRDSNTGPHSLDDPAIFHRSCRQQMITSPPASGESPRERDRRTRDQSRKITTRCDPEDHNEAHHFVIALIISRDRISNGEADDLAPRNSRPRAARVAIDLVHVRVPPVQVGPWGEHTAARHREEKIMLQRFELTITNDSNPNDVIHTFTWGETRTAAYIRTVDTMEDSTWDGYSFELAQKPTKIDKH